MGEVTDIRDASLEALLRASIELGKCGEPVTKGHGCKCHRPKGHPGLHYCDHGFQWGSK